MKSTRTIFSIGLVFVASFSVMALVGCGSGDTPVPTQAQVDAANKKRLAEVDKLQMPEAAKKTLESHMGGPAYENPAIAAAIANAKAHNANISDKSRKF